MTFTEVGLAGAWLITPAVAADDRGAFARVFDREAFAARGLATAIDVAAISTNDVAGTVRGLHYQAPPHGEAKLVRCAAGAVYDVIVDLRPGSPTRGRWAAFELTAANRRMLYLPPGLAHGFQTLADDTEVAYLLAGAYVPEAARGYRYDDPAFGVPWPRPVSRIAPRDLAWPPYRPEAP
jgi:dTDP-4-dehydrorhamnose 3,5-epimerase